MIKKLKDYINKTGVLAKPEILSMTREQIPSALLMKDAQKFIDTVFELIKAGKRICVVGDYDTDGVCSTSVQVRCLRLISKLLTGDEGKISYYIPHRFNDGYGISPKVIDNILLKNPKVDALITCDNGIVAFEAAEYAKQKGLMMLVTDHHLASEDGKLPDVVAAVNPNRVDDDYPFKGISGTVVVYKLYCEFARQHLPENISDFEAFVDFAGMSVISDVMDVTFENRVYLNEALDIFNGKSKYRLRFAWVAMIESLRRANRVTKEHEFTEKDFGFLFSPMLNAQSRVYGDASHGVETFLSQNTDDVREKAEFLIKVNEKRKEIFNDAFERVNKHDYSGHSAIVIRDDNLGDGFIGLVAGKITEKYNRPSVVFSETHKGILKGSARCPEGFNLIEVMSVVRPLTIKMGGHEGAAGLSIPVENLDEFTKKLNNAFSKVIPDDFTNKIEPDIILEPSELNVDFFRDLNSYRPFGAGFKYPVVSVSGMEIKTIKMMGKAPAGKTKPHVKYITKEEIDVVIWNGGTELPDTVSEGDKISAIGVPEENNFLGVTSIQLVATPNNVIFEKK